MDPNQYIPLPSMATDTQTESAPPSIMSSASSSTIPSPAGTMSKQSPFSQLLADPNAAAAMTTSTAALTQTHAHGPGPMSHLHSHPFHKHFWTEDETNALVEGCNKHGIGNWKAILLDKDIAHRFADRTAGDLKDRFRTYFPDTYHEVYPNAKTHHSHRVRGKDSAGHSIFQKVKPNQRRPFTPAEDDAIKRGYEKHGSHWSVIARDPVFAGLRRATDLRDRFRNAFPAEYEKAGYKPRPKPKRERRPSAHNVPSAPESLVGFDPAVAAALDSSGSSSALGHGESGGATGTSRNSTTTTSAMVAFGGLQRSFSSKRATPKVSNFDLTPTSETDPNEVPDLMDGVLARSFSGSLPSSERAMMPFTVADAGVSGTGVGVGAAAGAGGRGGDEVAVGGASSTTTSTTPAFMSQPSFLPRAQSAIDGNSPFRPTIWSSAMDAFLDPVQDLLDPVAAPSFSSASASAYSSSSSSSMWTSFFSGLNGTPGGGGGGGGGLGGLGLGLLGGHGGASVAPSHHPFAGDLHHHSVTNFSIDDLPKFIDMGSMHLPPLLSNWLDGSAVVGMGNGFGGGFGGAGGGGGGAGGFGLAGMAGGGGAGPSYTTAATLTNTSMIAGPASAPSHPGRSVSDGHTTTMSSAPSIAEASDLATVGRGTVLSGGAGSGSSNMDDATGAIAGPGTGGGGPEAGGEAATPSAGPGGSSELEHDAHMEPLHHQQHHQQHPHAHSGQGSAGLAHPAHANANANPHAHPHETIGAGSLTSMHATSSSSSLGTLNTGSPTASPFW